MSKRRRGIPMPDTIDAALGAARLCRLDCISLLRAAPIGGPVYQAASAALDAIDGLAGTLTGDRARFWTGPHGTPPPAAAEG